MGRLNTMTNVSGSYQMVTGTTYDPANRLLSISGNVLNETREYNTMGQLTQIVSSAVSGSSLNVTYNYSSTQNNGKITSQTDNLSGEQVVYAYDALNRLASAAATSNSWGQGYAYDGFGNLTDQTVTAGTAPSLSVVYNASNNRQTTDCADANGNVNSASSCGSSGYVYDVENRLHPPPVGTNSYFYSYAPGNKRVWRGAMDSNGNTTMDEVTFWSVTGQKLATYTSGGATLATANAYFGGRLIANNTGNVATDRLGSVGKYYPWGQVKPSGNVVGTEGFTGYFRDSETGLDYAKNRYHQPGMGRFMTPDPYMASGGAGEPGSWNRYAYAGGDPIKYKDPSGREQCDPDEGDNCAGFCDPCDPASDCYDPTCDCSGSGTGPSTQGGTKKKTIKITNVSTTSKQAQTVQNDLQALEGLIDANAACSKWLSGSGISPDQAITYILGGLGATGVTAGVGNFNGDSANAVEGTGGTTLPYGSMNITVNINGAFFYSNPGVGVGYGLPDWITGGTLAAQYEILLHELAHFTSATNFIGNDTSQNAQTLNNQAVMANCGTIVNAAGGR